MRLSLDKAFPIILFLLTVLKLYEKTATNLGVELPYIFAIQSILRLWTFYQQNHWNCYV